MAELKEKDFIHEEYKKNPYPFWIWLLLFALFAVLVWNGRFWVQDYMEKHISADPFLQVTNREITPFLWQNPEYMRINAKSKMGYLPAFQYIDGVTVEPELADVYVVAPPEIIFRYHVWNRLLKEEFIATPISVEEFKEFLKQAEEWQPRFWREAPTQYIKLIENLAGMHEQDLALLPLEWLPQRVRLSFQGWKNYYKNGEAINQIKPSYKEMNEFLQVAPHYARHYWRNITLDRTPKYLNSVAQKGESEEIIPEEELTPFLKFAFFNYQSKNLSH